MAARESQGYLIAVIILVLISLVLALVAFLGWSSASEHRDVRTALEAKEKFNEAYIKVMDNQTSGLKAMIGGYGASPSDIPGIIQNIKQAASAQGIESDQRQILNELAGQFQTAYDNYKADVAGTAATIDGDDVKEITYRERSSNLTSLVAVKVNENNIQRRQTEEAEANSRSAIERKQKELEVAQTATKKAQDELQTTKEAKLASEKRLKDEIADANSKLTDVNQAFEDYKQAKSKEIRDLNKDLADKTKDLEIARAEIISLTRQVYTTADGTISNVSGATQTAWINVGRSHGLRRNQKFAIYDASVTNFEANEQKGTIEVVRLSAETATARITEENPANPILTGDKILSPTWDPGKSSRFALIGKFDLDGDEVDDTDKLVRLIEQNGGEVAVRHDLDGNITGKIDTTVDYLIEGNGKNLEATSNYINAMNQIRVDADKFLVTEIDLDNLKRQIGYESKTRLFGIPKGGFSERGSLKNADR